MKRILFVVLIELIGGCATVAEYKQEKQLLLAPAPLNPPESKAILTSAYTATMRVAQTSTDQKNIAAYVSAGNAVNSMNCSDWLSRVTMTKRNIMFTDHQIGVMEGLATTLMGVGKVASSTVAVVGALEVAATGLSQNIQTDLLLAPSAYAVQTTLLGMLNFCSDQLRADAPGLSFGQAYTRLESCSRVCSFEAAQAATNNALVQTVTTVNPNSGALVTTSATTSSYQKDDSSARIIGYWMQAGAVNQANDAQLKIWMKAHGIETSVPFFAHSKLYEAARKQAVTDLNLPEPK